MLRENLEKVFMLPPVAVEWLMDLFECIQFLDDVQDKAEITQDAAYSSMNKLLVSLPNSPFWYQHGTKIAPILSVQFLKWVAANRAENNCRADAKSFVWRAGYYDIVLFVVGIVHGDKIAAEAAEVVLRLYGEDIESYLGEFKCQTQ
jgi:hypothetical protein